MVDINKHCPLTAALCLVVTVARRTKKQIQLAKGQSGQGDDLKTFALMQQYLNAVEDNVQYTRSNYAQVEIQKHGTCLSPQLSERKDCRPR